MERTEKQCTMKDTCNKLLTKLMLLSVKTSKAAQENVRVLIQDLVNSKIGVDEFCSGTGALLNTTFHKNVFEALKSGLPPLRLALFSRELSIDGINPPLNLTWGLTLQQNSMKDIRTPKATTAQVVYLNPKLKTEHFEGSLKSPSVPLRKIKTELLEIEKTSNRGTSKTLPITGTDEINNVFAMCGLDVEQESRMAVDRNFKFQFCPPENSFLQLHILQARLRIKIAAYGLEGYSTSVAELISCACKEYLKDAVEKLVIISEHRTDSLKNNPRYELYKDVRGQLNFLEDLDKAEQKRHKEVEREVLLRAAKSKTKPEDPEQARMKAKAKEMQRLEMEEMRQRDANMTALQAIGPRKKIKVEEEQRGLSSNDSTAAKVYGVTVPQSPVHARVKRITRQDMLFFMEHAPNLCRSQLLYETYLK